MVKNNRTDHLIAILEILRTGNWYEKQIQLLLRPFGISHEQYNVLRILKHNHPRPISLKEIQARMLNQTANTTRLVEKLRVKGFLIRKYSETNRRTLRITITGKGITLIEQIHHPLIEMDRRIAEYLSESDARDMVRILRSIRKSY